MPRFEDLNNKPPLPKNILILNSDSEETSQVKSLCIDLGTVYTAADLEKAISLLTTLHINVLIVDSALGHHSRLRGLFRPYTSVVVTGEKQIGLKSVALSWPADRYTDIALTAEAIADSAGFVRIIDRALRHSLLLQEIETLHFSLEQSDVELREAFHQIQEVKTVVEKSVVTELEKRIAMEAKFNGFKREKLKIEAILKKLYQANDVTMLLDIVYDIKDLVHAEGITMYIVDESDTTGKYLKPLVWDDSILSHTEFTKHIVLLDFQDFAAATARDGWEISSTNPADDRRLSSRYLQHLKTALESIQCVPIKQDREVIGVLEVYNKTVNGKLYSGGFTAEDRNVMTQICEHIAIAINKLNLIQYDALTGLLRPDPFFDRVIQKLQDHKRQQEEDSFALVMGDVDWFKHYNDRNGHEAGNRLLRELAAILKSSTREGDLLCRYGGEEFLFLLSCDNCDQESLLFTNRIRKNIENHYFDYQEFQPRKNLTMSFGVTHFTRERFPDLGKITKHNLIHIVSEADVALAEAKGKRRSGVFPEEISEEEFPPKNKIIVFAPKISADKEFPETISPPTPLPQAVKAQLEPKKEDRRKYKRYDTSAYLIYKHGTERKVFRTLNMSLGGVKVVAESEFDRGHSFELSLVLEDVTLDCKGDVIYCRPAETNEGFYVSGVKFRDLSFNDWKIMEQYFEDLLQIKEAAH